MGHGTVTQGLGWAPDLALVHTEAQEGAGRPWCSPDAPPTKDPSSQAPRETDSSPSLGHKVEVRY